MAIPMRMQELNRMFGTRLDHWKTMHFSSVFTREDASSLPVPVTKFNGTEGRLGQLVVTPEVVASKLNNMKDNTLPGVDGIAPKILKETGEQLSMPLAHVLTCHCRRELIL